MISLSFDIRIIVFSFHEIAKNEFCDICYLRPNFQLLCWLKRMQAPIFKNALLVQHCLKMTCAIGHLKITQLLSSVLTIDDMILDNYVALRTACYYNRMDVVHYWIRMLNVENHRTAYNSCFLVACYGGHVKVVELLSRFLTTDDMRANDNLVFRIASRNGHVAVVQFLGKFLIVNDMRACNNYAFYWACRNSHFEVVEFLSHVLSPTDKRAANVIDFYWTCVTGRIKRHFAI